jgi:hypothetical protein
MAHSSDTPRQAPPPPQAAPRSQIATGPQAAARTQATPWLQAATRLQAAMVALAPAALLAAFLSHPHLPGRLPNDAAVGAAVLADPRGWALSHLGFALASGLVALAFLAVRSHLRAAGEDRWSALGVPFVILGSTFYAVLPGMEFAPLAAAEIGADPAAAQGALGPWFVPLLFTAGLTFAVGAVAFAAGVVQSGILGRGTALLVAGALVVMAASRLVPFAVVQFHVQGLAALAALWPLAWVMWTAPALPLVRVREAAVEPSG